MGSSRIILEVRPTLANWKANPGSPADLSDSGWARRTIQGAEKAQHSNNPGILYFLGLLRNKACHKEGYYNLPDPTEFGQV